MLKQDEVTTAEKIKTRTVTGAGNITVTSIDAGMQDQDLSNISATGTVLVQHSSNSNFTFSGRFPRSPLTFSGGQIVTVTNSNAFETGKTFTVGAKNIYLIRFFLWSVVSGKTITGSEQALMLLFQIERYRCGPLLIFLTVL